MHNRQPASPSSTKSGVLTGRHALGARARGSPLQRLRAGAASQPKGAVLSRQLRGPPQRFLTQRRVIVGCSLVAIGAMGLISLYQMGLLKHLPEPAWPGLDADRVDGSPEAYKHFSTPDAVLGLGSYAATMALAEMGGTDRARRRPWIPLALAGKVLFDVGQMLRMLRDQWTKERAFCFWCLLSAVATFAGAPFVFGEAREAWRHLKESRSR